MVPSDGDHPKATVTNRVVIPLELPLWIFGDGGSAAAGCTGYSSATELVRQHLVMHDGSSSPISLKMELAKVEEMAEEKLRRKMELEQRPRIFRDGGLVFDAAGSSSMDWYG